MSKKIDRIRRATKTRAKIKQLGVNRLCVYKTPRHVYAQVIAPNGSQVLASSSSLDKEVKGQVKYSGNIDAAITVGKILAERAKKVGISKVAFDRSGFKYHGRIKALADAAREQGMEF
ncbi:50S ribosomal protein L18 [Gammaproteobacteria bacterium]|jgi:large subunit ribosomal protein L18|nr:50S ribosomal protein L18 [Gammaproteobacteria bacterium]|tara:strand:- start:212 stop:565 length:354 start_codon:yes stop_codon:yes gene_type:complete